MRASRSEVRRSCLLGAAASTLRAVTMPLERQFWGTLYGRLRDPFGHHWAFIADIEPVPEEEVREGASQTWPEHAGD